MDDPTTTTTTAGPLSALLVYDDVPRAAHWLERAFGFTERVEMRMLDADGRVKHAQLSAEGVTLILGNPSIHGGSPSKGVSTMLILRVPDVDEHHRRARDAGADIVIELADQPWGVRRYQASDCEGHQWQFEQPLPTDSGGSPGQ